MTHAIGTRRWEFKGAVAAPPPAADGETRVRWHEKLKQHAAATSSFFKPAFTPNH